MRCETRSGLWAWKGRHSGSEMEWEYRGLCFGVDFFPFVWAIPIGRDHGISFPLVRGVWSAGLARWRSGYGGHTPTGRRLYGIKMVMSFRRQRLLFDHVMGTR